MFEEKKNYTVLNLRWAYCVDHLIVKVAISRYNRQEEKERMKIYDYEMNNYMEHDNVLSYAWYYSRYLSIFFIFMIHDTISCKVQNIVRRKSIYGFIHKRNRPQILWAILSFSVSPAPWCNSFLSMSPPCFDILNLKRTSDTDRR